MVPLPHHQRRRGYRWRHDGWPRRLLLLQGRPAGVLQVPELRDAEEVPGGLCQGLPDAARQQGRAERRHHAGPGGRPGDLQQGALRLAVARHAVRPERRERTQRRRGQPARRAGQLRRDRQVRGRRRREGLTGTVSDTLSDDNLVVTSSPEGPSAAGNRASKAPFPARRAGRSDWRQRLEIALLAGPAIVMFITFVMFPVVLAAYYGFFKWKGYGPPTDFVGLQNYVTIFQDSTFQDALRHNAVIVVLSLLLQGPAAVLLALLLNQKMRGRALQEKGQHHDDGVVPERVLEC